MGRLGAGPPVPPPRGNLRLPSRALLPFLSMWSTAPGSSPLSAVYRVAYAVLGGLRRARTMGALCVSAPGSSPLSAVYRVAYAVVGGLRRAPSMMDVGCGLSGRTLVDGVRRVGSGDGGRRGGSFRTRPLVVPGPWPAGPFARYGVRRPSGCGRCGCRRPRHAVAGFRVAFPRPLGSSTAPTGA
jgi:hypothetical protein